VKKTFFAVFILLSIVIFLLISLKEREVSHAIKAQTVSIGGKTFQAEILDTDAKRIQGLSGREFLVTNTVMFFVFEKEDVYGIWMKDMKFSIDILWLNKNLEIVHIENSVSPETFPKVFYPSSRVLYVIETVAGFSLENEIRVGDRVQI